MSAGNGVAGSTRASAVARTATRTGYRCLHMSRTDTPIIGNVAIAANARMAGANVVPSVPSFPPTEIASSEQRTARAIEPMRAHTRRDLDDDVPGTTGGTVGTPQSPDGGGVVMVMC